MYPNKVLRILIADDDPDDRRLVALAFKEGNLNHKIDFVINGEGLIQQLEKYVADKSPLPDLILLDLNMPGKDGRVALKEIKANRKFHNIPIIILSTSISEEDQKYITALGVKKHFTKPPGFYELVDMMKEICNSLLLTGYSNKV